MNQESAHVKNLLPPLLALLALAATAAPAEEPLRVYMMGNSLTDNIYYDGFQAMAGHRNLPLVLGRHSIPGAPIQWLYDHPEEGFRIRPYGFYREAFTEYPWDAVTLQPFGRFDAAWDLEYARKLFDLCIEHSPDVQFYIYAQHGYGFMGDYTEQWDRDITVPDPGPKAQRTRAYYEGLVHAFRATQPEGTKPILLIPGGHVMALLDQKIKAGLLPDFDSIYEFYPYPDGTHMNNVGAFELGSTFFATLFGEDPTGVPTGPYQPDGSAKRNAPLSDTTARIITESVWQVVTANPLTGITSDRAVVIASPRVENAVVDTPYSFRLQPGYGGPPYTWAVSDGALPGGLTLIAGEGVIAGTPEAVGVSAFALTVTDARGDADAKTFTLTVAEDTAPRILTEELPPAEQAAPYLQQLVAEGGNGRITWSVTEGRLPPGLDLRSDGLLLGSTGATGTFSFTVTAADADRTGPETDRRAYTLSVGATDAEVYAADLLFTRDITLDGRLEEPAWAALRPAAKRVRGEAHDNVVRFGLNWAPQHLFIAIEVNDEEIREGDGVAVFIDGLNNREATYNADDRYFLISPDGRLTDHTGDSSQIRIAAAHTDGGYSVELAMNWKNLGFQPWDTDMDNWIVGIDIANVDADSDGESEVVWQGTENNRTDPSRFGSLILRGKNDGAAYRADKE